MNLGLWMKMRNPIMHKTRAAERTRQNGWYRWQTQQNKKKMERRWDYR